MEPNEAVKTLCSQSTKVRTKKPLSTISYNSVPFLEAKISELYKFGIITFACWISHYGELNLSTNNRDKNHIHLYLEFGRRVDPLDLQEAFKEAVSNNEKPLGVMPFRTSNFYDWYWYSLHDERYLESTKSDEQKKEYHYCSNDIHTLEEMSCELDNKIYQNPLKYTEQQRVLQVYVESIKRGYKVDDTEVLSKALPNCSLKNLGFAKRSLSDGFGNYFYSLAKRKVESERVEEQFENDDLVMCDENGEVIEEDDLPF